MNIQEIIAHASCNCGVTPSFNIPELPADIELIGRESLITEIIPAMNVDRSLDVNVTSRVFQPRGNKITLRSRTQDEWQNYIYVGQFDITDAQWLRYGQTAGTVTTPEIDRLIITLMTENQKWQLYARQEPYNNLSTKRFTALFRDHGMDTALRMNLIENITMNAVDINMPYVPSRVDAIYEEPNRMPYMYLYPTEFYSIDYRFQPYTYTFEMGENYIELIFRNTGTPKRLIIPEPIRIENETIVAQPKFKQYLIDVLAEKLALIYGMSTLTTMHAAAMVSYNILLKQQPVPMHPINPRINIRNVLKNGQSRYWRFDGFI